MKANNIVYDVLLVSQHYKPVVGYVGPEKYTCIFLRRGQGKSYLRDEQVCKAAWLCDA